jgi:hypothetical protein
MMFRCHGAIRRKAMTHKRSCSLTSGFVILAVVATLGTANAAPRSSTARANDAQLAQQPVYNYYNYPVEQVERPGCYLPSDGCLGEYSVQN